MKALKIIGIIVAVLVAALLIIPLFSPATVVVSSEKTIELAPEQVFPTLATFANREAWDPWVAKDSTVRVTIESDPGFVGSTYEWEGEEVGSGKMEVISVEEPGYISSHIWFMGAEDPAHVEWNLEDLDGATNAVWSFTTDVTYPFGRLGMMIGKGFLKKDFEAGLSNLKSYLEANPPKVSLLGPITNEVQKPFEALVAKGAGTMEEMAQSIGQLYGMVMAEVEKQGLEMAGPAFIHYLDYDEETGFANFLAGVQVNKPGRDAGEVKAASYDEMNVVQGLHTGPYEKFEESYIQLGMHVSENALDVTGEAFEFYIVDMREVDDPSKYQTIIAFPLK